MLQNQIITHFIWRERASVQNKILKPRWSQNYHHFFQGMENTASVIYLQLFLLCIISQETQNCSTKKMNSP